MGKPDHSLFSKKLRAAEKELTKGLIKWRYKRAGEPPPDEKDLDRGSKQIVEEAHRIIRKGGNRFFEELKQTKKEFLKACRDEDEKDKKD